MTYNKSMLQTHMRGTEHNKHRTVLVATHASDIGNWSTTIMDPDTEEELDLTRSLAKYESAEAGMDAVIANHSFIVAELVNMGYAPVKHNLKGIGAITEFFSKTLQSGKFSDDEMRDLEALAQKYSYEEH